MVRDTLAMGSGYAPSFDVLREFIYSLLCEFNDDVPPIDDLPWTTQRINIAWTLICEDVAADDIAEVDEDDPLGSSRPTSVRTISRWLRSAFRRIC